MRTRTPPSKQGVALSKTLGHVAIHPKIMELGEVAGGDEKEEARLKLVQQYLGSYRPKETVLELQSAPEASREAMAKKRSAHPEKHDDVSKRRYIRRDEEHEEDGAKMDSDSSSDDGDEVDDEGDDDDDGEDEIVSGGGTSAGVSAASAHGELNRAPATSGKVRVGEFGGAFKDPKFFLSYTPDASANRAEIDGLKVKDTMGGERDVILDLMGDDEKAMTQSGRMVWDRRKKKYVGFNEADDKHSSVKSTTSTRQLVNEAGKRLTKKDADKKRGKMYEEWAKKTKQYIPVAGELENPETADKYKSLQRRSGWKAAPEPKGFVLFCFFLRGKKKCSFVSCSQWKFRNLQKETRLVKLEMLLKSRSICSSRRRTSLRIVQKTRRSLEVEKEEAKEEAKLVQKEDTREKEVLKGDTREKEKEESK